MKFEEAFDKVFEIEKKRAESEGKSFAVTPASAKTMAYFWSMLAVAASELDDIVYLGKHNEIISTPIPGKTKKKKVKKEPKSKKGQKSLSDKTASTVDNGKEKETKEATATD